MQFFKYFLLYNLYKLTQQDTESKYMFYNDALKM